MMIYYRAVPHWSILLVPVCLLLAMVVAFGIGVWLSVLNLFNRDISHALPFTIQLLFFVTPVAYPASLVPPAWRLAYSLNPMVGILEWWRWILFATPLNISLPQLAASLAVGAVVTFTGLWYFSHEEPTLADVGET
jgi:lipopolysaccharide transport system permease protein